MSGADDLHGRSAADDAFYQGQSVRATGTR